MAFVPDTARATAQRRSMLPSGSSVLALVSGGADSVALLRLLAAGDLGEIGPLSVLHVNHMLRAEEADADAAFVETLCADLGVPCTVARFDVGAYAAEQGLNLEDAGRRIRYRFAEEALDAACDAAGVARDSGRIAVAHNRDDRVETFFMRAITGSGAAGLSSIPYERGRVVRPLLDCDRAAIRAYLRDILGQPWREDATNADTARLRALVRAEIVPVAEGVNPSFRDTLTRSIDLLADDEALLSNMAAEHVGRIAEIVPGKRVAFDCTRLSELPRAMARRVLRSAITSAFPWASRLEASHVEAIVDGLDREGFARDLPFELRAEREYGRLVVLHANAEAFAVAPSLLLIPGVADLGEAGRMFAEEVSAGDVSGRTDSVTIDAGSARWLVIDSVRVGDRMRPLGMEGTRKLSDMLIDAKVARRERPAVPVVRDSERIVWVAGVRMSEDYRVHPGTSRAVRLTWQRPDACA
jgi:tRNA(Ile)-lysidine synthase